MRYEEYAPRTNRSLTVAIHQPSYLVWPPLLEKMELAGLFIYLDDVQFTQNSEIHRNRVLSPNGWKWLSVPTRSPRDRPINEIVTVGLDWKRDHLNRLRSYYGKAPFYRGELRDSFETQYQNARKGSDELLADVNYRSTEWLRNQIGVRTPTVRASELAISTSGSQRVLDLCLAVGADRYLTGPGAYGYLDFDSFSAAGIEVLVQNYRHDPYPQVFSQGEFVPRLSAADMLFNVGPSCLDDILSRGAWETVDQHQLVAGR